MPFDPTWKPVALVMPDSRTREPRRTSMMHPILGEIEKVYCANCHKDGGWVSGEWAAHIFYLCDECDEKHGQPAVPLPEELVRTGRL